MDIQLGAPVVSHDGADLGKIDKVIFDPASGETKSIVVRKGVILGRDVAIPTQHIRVAAPSRVELDMSQAEVEALPDFFEADYSWPPQTWVAPYGWPAGGVLWPAAYPGEMPIAYPATAMSREEEERLRKADLENAVVGQGADVVAMGGEKVGSVHNVVVDPASHKPSSVVVRRGVLFTEDVELPGDWVASVDDERVTLNVDKVTVEQLAKRRK
ncbi:MAG TPA: PRC-barrel domain-containing protein [Chloroflexota bacterium]|nr:PRC-barrel domain-containing protein [Chloroflexota bacterium]